MKFFLLLPAATALLGLAACFSAGQYDRDLTPEEFSRLDNHQRIEYLEARERAKKRQEQELTKRAPAEKDGAAFDFSQRNSVKKRERMNNMKTPVLLEDDSSIFSWKQGKEPRSKTLNRNQIDRSTKY